MWTAPLLNAQTRQIVEKQNIYNMTKQQNERRKRLTPKGIPKYLRIYDNGGGSPFFCKPCLEFVDADDVVWANTRLLATPCCKRCQGKLLPVTGGTFDRYTVVFTGRAPVMKGGSGQPNQYPYLGMSCNPCHPLGFGQHGHTGCQPCDTRPGSGWPPPVGGLSPWGSRRITWKQLPRDCQKLVLQDYKAIWGL